MFYKTALARKGAHDQEQQLYGRRQKTFGVQVQEIEERRSISAQAACQGSRMIPEAPRLRESIAEYEVSLLAVSAHNLSRVRCELRAGRRQKAIYLNGGAPESQFLGASPVIASKKPFYRVWFAAETPAP